MKNIFQNVQNHSIKKENEKNEKVADPLNLVNKSNLSKVRELTEVHFGNMGLYSMRNFDQFQNLETIWLNDNYITSLEGLSFNFRLKNLYVFNNLIIELNPTLFKKLCNIENLSIYNNKIINFENTCDVLSKLWMLKKLELFGNPIANQSNYKNTIIKNVHSLKIFDRNIVTEEERSLLNRELKFKNIKKNKTKQNIDRTYKISNQLIKFSIIENLIYQRVTKKNKDLLL